PASVGDGFFEALQVVAEGEDHQPILPVDAVHEVLRRLTGQVELAAQVHAVAGVDEEGYGERHPGGGEVGQRLGHAVLQQREIVPGQIEHRVPLAVPDRGVNVHQAHFLVLADVQGPRHQDRLGAAAGRVQGHRLEDAPCEVAAGVPGDGVGRRIEGREKVPVDVDLDTHDA